MSPARAQEPRFGGPGQWVLLGSSNGLHVFRETFSQSQAKYQDASVAVGVDHFVARHLSIGLDASAGYFDNQGYGVDTLEETKTTSISGGARFGYDVPLGKLFSWYPRVTLAILRTHSKTMAVAGGNGFDSSVSSSIGPAVNLYAPLLLHLAPHFFVGFGPRLHHNFGVQRGGPYDGTQFTRVSGELVVGGWWGGAEADSPAEVADLRDSSFGKRGQLVLGLATDAWVSHRMNSASRYSETAFGVAPSADYFVLDNFSIGIDAFISHSSGTARDPNDTPTDLSSTDIGLGPRIGTNVPITKKCSVWPQVELGYGVRSVDQSSRDGTNQHSSKRLWLRLSAPVLVNVTSHFLVGAGPYFFHELYSRDQYGLDNKAESVGVSLFLGGWL